MRLSGFRRSAMRHYALFVVTLVALAVAPVTLNTVAQSEATPVPSTQTPDNKATTEITTELPPPDIPVSNQYGYTFEFESTLKAELETLEREAPVYLMEIDPISLKQAEKITGRLEIGGELVDHGDGTYEASGDGEVYISPELIQYFSLAAIGDGDLPSDEAAVILARDWLRERVLLPKNANEGRVVGRSDETSRIVVQFMPSEPAVILSAYPAVVVTLGPDGIVLEASSRWADVERGDLYQLRSPDDAWDEVSSGQGFIEVDVPLDVAEPGETLVGKAIYDTVEVVYTTAGPPGGERFLEPIYVFSGKVKLEGEDKSYPIRTYVAAIANSGEAVG